MAQILVNVSDGQKGLWVAAAHDERVSLSEWIRRRCDDGLGRGAVVSTAGRGVTDTGSVRESPDAGGSGSPAPPPSPLPTSVREFKGPDPKGGLAAGETGRTGRGRGSGGAPPSPAASSCTADTPKGVRCKLCGKTH